MFHTKVVKKTKTHTSCSITFSENRAIYEIMWKNIVELDRPLLTIYDAWALHAGKLRQEYRHILRICNTSCFSTPTMVTRMCLYVTLYVHCLPCCTELHAAYTQTTFCWKCWAACHRDYTVKYGKQHQFLTGAKKHYSMKWLT